MRRGNENLVAFGDIDPVTRMHKRTKSTNAVSRQNILAVNNEVQSIDFLQLRIVYVTTCKCTVTTKLSRCWDSVTCEQLDAAEVHMHMPLVFVGSQDPGQQLHAGSQDTDLSRHVPTSTFCCTMWSQPPTIQMYRQTDGWMHWQTDVMLVA